MHSLDFNTFIREQLNAAQQEAVLHRDGPILVIAGAGSGKTRVITARITHLMLNHYVPSQSIVALTFTNKAANEMKERITRFLGTTRIPLPFIGTFHAYCLRLLRQYDNSLDTPHFTILDGDDQIKLVNALLQRTSMHKTIAARAALYTISQVKNQLIDATQVRTLFTHPSIEQLYFQYEKEKKASKCFDFDDLMLEVLRLFKTNSIFQQTHQNNITHILVDEYQDTNVVQHELLRHMVLGKDLMASENQINSSVCAVGDEDQSIYSWRGATIANIANFKKDFSNTKVIKIEQNYRSVQPILELANTIIKYNVDRTPKKLWSNRLGVDRVRILTCLSEYQEGDSIAQCIKIAWSTEKCSSIAVLYRTHIQSRAIEESLIKHSIPYIIIGGIQFYERKEIKDLFAYLRLVVNPFDRVSFFRIVNTPIRGLGEKCEDLIRSYWDEQPFLSFRQIINALISSNTLKPTKKAALEQLLSCFNDVAFTTAPSVALNIFIKKTRYTDYLKHTYEAQEAQERIDNIHELLDATRHFEENGINTIELLLHEIALMQDKAHKQDNNHRAVFLMTLHAAKGLEFDTVILAGLEEGILPSGRALNSSESIEEERRLLYVGITRAKEHLLITHSKYRYTYGKMVDQTGSRFLDEIPSYMASRHDNATHNHVQLNSFFAQWFNITQQHNSVTTFGSANTLPFRTAPQPDSARAANSKETAWRIHQPVRHAQYGIGTIKNTEIKSDDTYITVSFKTGTKKISARFLERV